MLNYFRTGQYYLNKGGPYRKFFPEVLKISKGRFHVDYAYHLAPMDGAHIREIPELVAKHGVSSFKIFMFYGSHGLHGRSDAQRDFLMIGEDERYDYAHFEFVMRGVQAAREQFPDLADDISLSLHCETAEIMTAYTKIVEKDGKLKGLAAYSASRPQHSEGLAVFIAAYLANETALPNINLLHLSSRKAVEAALQMAAVFPHIDFRREVTIGHLMLDITSKAAELAKVNPPIRPREDVEFLWEKLLEGKIDWVVSDHACCRHETKVAKNISATSGSPSPASAAPSTCCRRWCPRARSAACRTTTWRGSRAGTRRAASASIRRATSPKGWMPTWRWWIRADTWTIRAKDSESTQGYTPFEGSNSAPE